MEVEKTIAMLSSIKSKTFRDKVFADLMACPTTLSGVKQLKTNEPPLLQDVVEYNWGLEKIK